VVFLIPVFVASIDPSNKSSLSILSDSSTSSSTIGLQEYTLPRGGGSGKSVVMAKTWQRKTTVVLRPKKVGGGGVKTTMNQSSWPPWKVIVQYGQAFLEQQKQNAEERKKVFYQQRHPQWYRERGESRRRNLLTSVFFHLLHTIQLTFAMLTVAIVLLFTWTTWGSLTT
jgi:hypothetical protein